MLISFSFPLFAYFHLRFQVGLRETTARIRVGVQQESPVLDAESLRLMMKKRSFSFFSPTQSYETSEILLFISRGKEFIFASSAGKDYHTPIYSYLSSPFSFAIIEK
ncbi:MAG: hypothetical protein EOM19_04965 [Candidatus Moranbacteria bacterium]|nr:hypothetical protein [Candidatus Moranbacteria bacterium]